ncbi:MAG: hypothetical protein EZS28_023000 [Streblomastix strix]|uniref:Uncharacterized protein n=1 Tax=Streblomastix strix TaxID=222440 RepID=A0A5J4VGC4_9EUKA|nr:MAG: hypothetical protein EZS28_023000 [Streblomastix strix]
MNELLNFGQQQKQKVSKQLEKDYPINNQEIHPDSVLEPDIQLEQTIAQENFTDREHQKLQSDVLSESNLNTVCDIGALDWSEPPINDIYGRSPFETYKAGYKYEQFGNPQPYMKKPVAPVGKKDTNTKKTIFQLHCY